MEDADEEYDISSRRGNGHHLNRENQLAEMMRSAYEAGRSNRPFTHTIGNASIFYDPTRRLAYAQAGSGRDQAVIVVPAPTYLPPARPAIEYRPYTYSSPRQRSSSGSDLWSSLPCGKSLCICVVVCGVVVFIFIVGVAIAFHSGHGLY